MRGVKKMMNPQGERIKVGLEGSLRLEFHGAKVTSEKGLLVYCDLDELSGLIDLAVCVLKDTRIGCNIRHQMFDLLRQSAYSRLAVYEDVNDAAFICGSGDTGGHRKDQGQQVHFEHQYGGSF